MRSKWVEQRIQDLSKEQIDELFANEPREFESDDKEYRFLARRIVMRAFEPIKRAINHNQWLNINGQFLHLLRVTPS